MLNITNCWSFPGGSESKASACNAGGLGLIHGTERSLGEGNGNPLQYSCLENPMDREIVHGVARHAKKQMKRCSTSLIIKKCKPKLMRYHLNQSGWPSSKNVQTISTASYTIGRNILVQSTWRIVWRFLKKLKIELPYDPAIPLLDIHIQRKP